MENTVNLAEHALRVARDKRDDLAQILEELIACLGRERDSLGAETLALLERAKRALGEYLASPVV